MLSLNNLSCGYQKKIILHNLNAQFENGTISTIIGPNGCGKSTLLKSIVGLSQVQDGNILLDNKSIINNQKYSSKRISYLSQIHTAPSLSVQRTILHGRFPYLSYPRHYTELDQQICEDIMKQIGIYHLRNKITSTLSGGEIQKVFLAMSLVSQADVYLFDEPNSFLDIHYQLELFDIMKKLRSEGKIVISILHDLNYAMQIADQVIIIDSGNLRGSGTPDAIYTSRIIDDLFHIHLEQIKLSSQPVQYLIQPK